MIGSDRQLKFYQAVLLPVQTSGTVKTEVTVNSVDKLRHPRSDAYSAEQVLLNKRQIYGGAPKVNCYPNQLRFMNWSVHGQKMCTVQM